MGPKIISSSSRRNPEGSRGRRSESAGEDDDVDDLDPFSDSDDFSGSLCSLNFSLFMHLMVHAVASSVPCMRSI